MCADQLTRQIQLEEEVNATMDSLFQTLCGDIDSVSDVVYTVPRDGDSYSRKTQIHRISYQEIVENPAITVDSKLKREIEAKKKGQ